MIQAQLQTVVQHAHRVGTLCETHHRSDRDLLLTFVTHRDPDALRVIVERHASLVLSVCRRMLSPEDADDAFQATFLALTQRAETVRNCESLASWLYSVAVRIALKIRRSEARRKQRDQLPRRSTESDPVQEASRRELQTILDEEIQRLPEHYRTVFVHSCLKGRTRVETASELGLKVGTVASRFDQAKRILRKQLVKRGVTLSVALAILSDKAKASSEAINAIVHAEPVTSRAFTLAQGVNDTMKSKIKWSIITLLTLGMLTTGFPPHSQKVIHAQEKSNQSIVVLRGRVLQDDGTPASGATVQIRKGNSKPTAQTTCDDRGRFQIRVNRSESASGVLLAQRRGLIADWIQLSQRKSDEGLTLRLVRDKVIEGKLVDLQGQPVRGATVKINAIISLVKGPDLSPWIKMMAKRSRGGGLRPPPAVSPTYGMVKRIAPSSLGLKRTRITDKQGRFQIRGVGRERLVNLWIQGDALASTFLTIMTRDQKQKGLSSSTHPARFTAVIAPGKVIFGVVRDKKSKKPIAGAHVYASNSSSTTNAKGEYRISGLAKREEYRVDVFSEGHFARVLRARDTTDVKPIRADLELESGIAVTGRVVDASTGKPVSGRVIYIIAGDNKNLRDYTTLGSRGIHPSTCTMRSDGTFQISTIPGRGWLCIFASDRKRYVRERMKNHDGGLLQGIPLGQHPQNFHQVRELNVDEKKPQHLGIKLRRGVNRELTVMDPRGTPLKGVALFGRSSLPEQGPMKLLATEKTLLTGLDSKAPRKIALFHKQRQLGLVASVTGSDEPLQIRLKPLTSAAGRVVDAKGKALANKVVVMRLSRRFTDYRDLPLETLFKLGSELQQSTRTDANGRFKMPGLLPGLKYSLNVYDGAVNRSPIRVAKDSITIKEGRLTRIGALKSRR